MNEKVRKNIPYYKIAKEALIKWNGLSEKEADKEIETLSFEEIENKIHAKTSIEAAANGIIKYFNQIQKEELFNNDSEYKLFLNSIFNDTADVLIFDKVRKKFTNKVKLDKLLMNEMILQILSDIHDTWVINNKRKFFEPNRNKEYQHLPIKFIGWNNVESDLLFLKPILEIIGIEVNEKEIKDLYFNQSKESFDEINNVFAGSVENYMKKQIQEYNYIEEEVKRRMLNLKFIDEILITQIREKGIGKDGKVFKKYFK